MSAPGKGSALADIASDLGSFEACSPVVPEGGEVQGDLLAFDQELDAFEGATIAPAKKRGRPPGSPNRTTLQLKRLLLARSYRDPAEFLAAIITADVRDLARQLTGKSDEDHLGVDVVIETLKQQIRAAAELMPYFHQKMPLAVQHTGDQARPLIVIAGHGAVPVQAGVAGDGALSVHSLIDQALSAGGDATSHGAPSHDQVQVIEGQAKHGD